MLFVGQVYIPIDNINTEQLESACSFPDNVEKYFMFMLLKSSFNGVFFKPANQQYFLHLNMFKLTCSEGPCELKPSLCIRHWQRHFALYIDFSETTVPSQILQECSFGRLHIRFHDFGGGSII